ncbi:MAG: ATP-dependent helicase [Dehalococcoidia bacterium]|nr:ATP-dependent helicase [Dehalococcoidia bacterium]
MAWNTGLVSPYLDIAAYPGSPLRVMAGPGTGKTSALMRRIARLLESGVSPSSILAVSFTRTAANDLVYQLKLLGTPGADRVIASTLHSLCFALLNKNAVFQAINRVARPLIGFEVDCMVTDLATNFGGKRAASELLKAFEAYWATLQHHQPGWPQNPVQQHFHRELLHWLTHHRAMLIGELPPRALDYILQNPASLEVPSYAHVLADEYQDLNRADQVLIDALAQRGTLTVIGDEDQSIYTVLRHARPDGIVQFHQTYPNTHDVPLHDCIRCPTQVVHMANSLILHNHPQRPSTIRPVAKNGPGEVYIVQHNSIQDEITCIAAFIDWYLANHAGVKPGEVLVLSTRRFIGYAIRDELVRLGHAAQSFFTEECLKKLTAKEGFCLLTLLVRPDDRPALRTWLGLDHNNWRTTAYQRIWQAAEASGISPRELLDRIAAGSVQAPPHTSDLVQRYADLSERLAPLAGMTEAALIDMLWPPGNPDCADIRGIALMVVGTAQSPAQILDELVSTIIQPELPGERDDVIRVMSLHKSKGLTAKCVVVSGCVAGALPTLRAGLSSTAQQQAIEEQRRLFYVAITRTAHTLVLSSAASAPYGDAMQMGLVVARRRGGSAVLQASPFMSEIGAQALMALSGNQWRSNLGF